MVDFNLKIKKITEEVIVKYDALLFDLDGVIINSLLFDIVWVPKLLKKYHCSNEAIKLVDKNYIKSIFALQIDDFWKEIINKVNIDKKLLNNIVSEFEEIALNNQYFIFEQVIEIIDLAKLNNVKTALVSNNYLNRINTILHNNNLTYCFDVVVGIDSDGSGRKPSPEPYLAACSLLNVLPSKALVFEDSIIGATSGKNAGCDITSVISGATSTKQFIESNLLDYYLDLTDS